MDRDWILKQAGGSGSRAKVLETIGVLARSSQGGYPFDRFRGRGLFTIRDAQGRPVGMGGRLLPGVEINSPAKYLNSPETPLFRKSHLLYGLDLAKEAFHKSKQKTALVMEGYTDVIIAHQFGFNNAVAVLGVALGETHIRILKRFVDRIVLVLDGDEAGQKRANEVLELFIAQQADLRILTLPDNLDPCDFLQQRGAEAFAELLATGTVDALDHAFRSATRGIDLDRDIHAASQALERLIAIVAKAPRLQSDTSGDARLREERFLQRFATMFRVSESEVRRRLTALRRRSSTTPVGNAFRCIGTERNGEGDHFADRERTDQRPRTRIARTARRLSRNMVRSPGGAVARTARVARAAANIRNRMPAFGRRRAAWL